MPRTPDRVPGASDEEGTNYESTSVATAQGEQRYTGTRFSLYDSIGEYDPRSGSGLSAAQHRDLDQLVHGIAETSFDEYIKTGNKVTSIITWTDNSKTVKIREETFAYTGNQINTITTEHYDGAGVLITGETMVETFNFTGANLDDVDRVVS